MASSEKPKQAADESKHVAVSKIVEDPIKKTEEYGKHVTVTTTELTVTKTDVEVEADSEAEAKEIAVELVENVVGVGKGVAKYLGGFRTFILRGNLVDLAVGIVIGAAFTSLVNSLVSDLLTPLIPVYGGGLSTATWDLPWTPVPDDIHYGKFINAVISFLIVGAVLYFFVVHPVTSLMNYYNPPTTTPETHECPYCFQSINVKATRCPHCTSRIKKDDIPEKEETVDKESFFEQVAETLLGVDDDPKK